MIKRKQITAFVLALALAVTAVPQQARAALMTDTNGTMYGMDAAGFVCQIPKSATTEKGCVIYMYSGKKTVVTFPAKCESYTVTKVSSNMSKIIRTKFQAVKLPGGYLAIGKLAFQNQTDLYRIEIPATVKSTAADAFSGCDTSRLTIVTPYGSYAEKYAKAHGIHYTNSTSLQIQAGYAKMYAGEKRQIAVLNSATTPVWKSTDTKIASVDKNGTVTAKNAGSVKITATIGTRTYTYPYTVTARTQANVLEVVWNQYVTAGMSDYERAVATQQWMEQNVSTTGTAILAKNALESGKANYRGFCEAYQLIVAHYGMSAEVVSGTSHMENSVVIAGTNYTASTLASAATVDKKYTTTTLGVALNKCTMVLSVGKKGRFRVSETVEGLTFASSNKKVAVVNKNGKVTAKGAGTATITMKANGKTFVCTVRVNP